MKVQAKQFGFDAVIRQSSDKRYLLTIMVNHAIAGYPAPMIMVNKYSSFDEAHHQLYRLLGLIAQEHKHG